jgi:hypothetical protein
VTYRFRIDDLRITRNESSGVVYYVVEDQATGVRHRLYEAEYQTAVLLDGKRSAAKVARTVAENMGVPTEEVDVDRFALQLLSLGFVERG